MPLSEPAVPRAGQKLLYLRSIPEAYAQITRWETNQADPRFGQPTEYQITFGDPEQSHGDGLASVTKVVHWTRVLHVCDGGITYARPRMKQVLPRILDCRKILGADAEAYWQQVVAGTFFETDPSLAGDVRVDATGLMDEYEKYLQGLQRAMVVNGFTAKRLPPDMADPSPHLAAQIRAICIRLNVPERTFMGSELGRLAADQDSRKWAATCRSRRGLYVTPRLIAPLVDRLMWLGVLPEPKEYRVWWPDAEAQTQDEKANVALKLSQALAAYAKSGAARFMGPLDYLVRLLGWTEEEAEAAIDNAVAMAPEEPEKPEAREEPGAT